MPPSTTSAAKRNSPATWGGGAVVRTGPQDIFVPRGAQEYLFSQPPIKIFRDCLRVFLFNAEVYGPLLKLMMREYNAMMQWWSQRKTDDHWSLSFGANPDGHDAFQKERQDIAMELEKDMHLTELQAQMDQNMEIIARLTQEQNRLKEEKAELAKLAPVVEDLTARLAARDEDVQDLRNKVWEMTFRQSPELESGERISGVVDGKALGQQAGLAEVVAQLEEEREDLSNQLKEALEQVKKFEDSQSDQSVQVQEQQLLLKEKDAEIADLEQQLDRAFKEAADFEQQAADCRAQQAEVGRRRSRASHSGSQPSSRERGRLRKHVSNKIIKAQRLASQVEWPDHVRRYAIALWDALLKGFDASNNIPWEVVKSTWCTVDPAISPDIEALLDAVGRTPSSTHVEKHTLLRALKGVFNPQTSGTAGGVGSAPAPAD